MTDDSEVFNFSSDEFSKLDLITALNDMVIEYKKLLVNFNETILKNKSDSTNSVNQSNETDALKIKVTELLTENDNLKEIVQNTIF